MAGGEAQDRAGSASGQSEQILELSGRLSGLEERLQSDFSLSEASKYALKKDIAKVRANIMRLKRDGQQRT
jgi:predicted AAA+ superfamily ATPase